MPGSTAFLLVGLLIGLVLLYAGGRRIAWSRRWLTGLGLLYLMLSLWPVANTLTRGLQGPHGSIASADQARGARLVVVIGGGAVSYSSDGHAVHLMGRRTAFTVLEAARLYRLLDPAWMVTSGGIPDPATQQRPESDVMRDALVGLGVPADRILLESQSRTTAEQVTAVAQLYRERGLSGPVVLVMTGAHAGRVMSVARAAGLDAVPSVATDYTTSGLGWRQWRPTMGALRASEAAAYEYLAGAYYWMNGSGQR